MSADGTWNLTMQTPMGERRSTLTLATSGGSLTGSQEAEGNTTDITDGSVVRGPATAGQPVLESRETEGRVEVRLRQRG